MVSAIIWLIGLIRKSTYSSKSSILTSSLVNNPSLTALFISLSIAFILSYDPAFSSLLWHILRYLSLITSIKSFFCVFVNEAEFIFSIIVSTEVYEPNTDSTALTAQVSTVSESISSVSSILSIKDSEIKLSYDSPKMSSNNFLTAASFSFPILSLFWLTYSFIFAL
ncbi:hypothetical protein MASR1M68_08380 [Elusimicrobiota bacterium]